MTASAALGSRGLIRWAVLLAMIACGVQTGQARAATFDPAKLPGIVVDDSAAEFIGEWQASTHTQPFIGGGYHHDQNREKGDRTARFSFQVPAEGTYRVLLGYIPGDSRAENVPITIQTADGEKPVTLNQRNSPRFGKVLEPLGDFRFTPDTPAAVTVANAGTKGYVIVDALVVLTLDEARAFEADVQQVFATAEAGSRPVPAPPPEPFQPIPPTRPVARLTSAELDRLLEQQLGAIPPAAVADDAQFLRRATLDLLGRQPTVDELQRFLADPAPEKRVMAVDSLLQQPAFGTNWANYWSDVIGYRQMEPELTYHNYQPFKHWLAGQIQAGVGWDATVAAMLTATGKIAQRPDATFVGFHQGNAHRLAGETSRVFLGVQIQCAECHDHPFIDLPQTTFHGFAAFFARTDAKIAEYDSNNIEVTSKDSGEHKLNGQGDPMVPTLLDGNAYSLGMSDLERRTMLARWIVAGDNPHFARAHVNHVWARLMGQGFAEPVDDLGEGSSIILPEVHAALADHFIATGYDVRDLFRLCLNSRYYQRTLANTEQQSAQPFAAAETKKLRGDEVFSSLATAVNLTDAAPPRLEKTSATRFPPPPKTTRDLVDDAFGYDPSFADENVIRTMKQAMFLMNNEQVQGQIEGASGSATLLAELLQSQPDDTVVITTLFERTLARRPTERELEILRAHLAAVADRESAFEDVLWSLLNSAEFTTRN